MTNRTGKGGGTVVTEKMRNLKRGMGNDQDLQRQIIWMKRPKSQSKMDGRMTNLDITMAHIIGDA